MALDDGSPPRTGAPLDEGHSAEAAHVPPPLTSPSPSTSPPPSTTPPPASEPIPSLSRPAAAAAESSGGLDGPPPAPAEPTGGGRRRRRKKKSSPARSIIEWVLVIGGALVVALIIRTFFLAAFYIPTASMVPTLQEGDRVLVNKLSYKLHSVNRGDIVVFTRPESEPDTGIEDYIKRVIGLPGDTVQGKDGHVLVNGQVLNEPYLDAENKAGTSDFGPVQIPAGQVWVMGDNRVVSIDSRTFGPIKESKIVGRAFVRIWPLSHLGFL